MVKFILALGQYRYRAGIRARTYSPSRGTILDAILANFSLQMAMELIPNC